MIDKFLREKNISFMENGKLRKLSNNLDRQLFVKYMEDKYIPSLKGMIGKKFGNELFYNVVNIHCDKLWISF